MSTDDENSPYPKSMRHKQILDVATENPEASIDELASMVPSATTDLVESVLEEHGDPGMDEPSNGNDPMSGESNGDQNAATDATIERKAVVSSSGKSDQSMDSDTVGERHEPDQIDDSVEAEKEPEEGSETSRQMSPPDEKSPSGTGYPSLDDLSYKQIEVLEQVAKRPEATQREIAEELDVTAATISNRINSISGFEWSNRELALDEFDDTFSPMTIDSSGSHSRRSPAQQSIDSETESAENDVDTSTANSMATGNESGSNSRKKSIAPIHDSTVTENGTPSDQICSQPTDTALDQMETRLSSLEATVEALTGNISATGLVDSLPIDDAELAQKMLHACLEADAISEEEERRIIESLLS